MTLSVEDRLDIQQLYGRYNFAIDFGDASGWAATFTPDGTFASGNGTFSGPEQLEAFAKGFAERIKGRHWINNLVIDGSSDGATGKCYLVLYRLGDGAPSVLTTAVYNDELKRTADGWRFKSRKVTADA